jgi:NDP-sugar pyrophosphorylase family protein
MKMDCVIILGPSSELHPLVTEDCPKFMLPFMNIPLVNLSLNYLSSFSCRFFIVCLEKYVDMLTEILVSSIPVEYITIPSYEGIGYVLNLVKPRVMTTYFIMCKGDLYGLEPLNTLLESFSTSDDDIYVSIMKSSTRSPLLCIDSMNYIKMYNDPVIPILKNQKYVATVDYAIKDFFKIYSNQDLLLV